jgi:serine protease Do
MTLTLGDVPNERQAKAATEPKDMPGAGTAQQAAPRLGLSIAPAASVAGAGDKGLVVTGVEADGLAAEHGFKTGDVILDVGGKAVTSAADVRNALLAAQKASQHTVLMHVRSGDATKFVAVPIAMS